MIPALKLPEASRATSVLDPFAELAFAAIVTFPEPL